MSELREGIRAHPIGTALALALWGAVTWLAGASGGFFLFLLLLLPGGVAAFLIGRWRWTRGARSSGLAAALIASVALLDLSIAALMATSRLGVVSPLRLDWEVVRWLGVGAVVIHVFALASGYVGWLFGHEAVYPDEVSKPVG